MTSRITPHQNSLDHLIPHDVQTRLCSFIPQDLLPPHTLTYDPELARRFQTSSLVDSHEIHLKALEPFHSLTNDPSNPITREDFEKLAVALEQTKTVEDWIAFLKQLETNLTPLALYIQYAGIFPRFKADQNQDNLRNRFLFQILNLISFLSVLPDEAPSYLAKALIKTAKTTVLQKEDPNLLHLVLERFLTKTSPTHQETALIKAHYLFQEVTESKKRRAYTGLCALVLFVNMLIFASPPSFSEITLRTSSSNLLITLFLITVMLTVRHIFNVQSALQKLERHWLDTHYTATT